MKKYVAVLGRQPRISVAELESLYENVRMLAPFLAEFEAQEVPDVRRLGGTLKVAVKVDLKELLEGLPETGKIVVGVSDFSRGASAFLAQKEAIRIKQRLKRMRRSARAVANKTAVLSSATSLHNGLFTETKIELLKLGHTFYRVIQVQDIESYVQRDRERPARDAKVGMLPPKLAQILLNLCGKLPSESRVLDPFCGTGVVLQESVLMGYIPYGTDLNERMVEYSRRNLKWLYDVRLHGRKDLAGRKEIIDVEQGDATTFQWTAPISGVACETYLGPPMSVAPVEIKLKQAKQECKSIILGFLKNLGKQVESGTPVVIAVPAWLRPDGKYERLNLLDEIEELRYNVRSFKNLGQDDLMYYRDGQVVAREIIVLRKK